MKKAALIIVLFLLSIKTVLSENNTYSINDVVKHQNPSDCWVIFGKNIYDLTDYLNLHDRYMDIRTWCGKDITLDFETKADIGRDHKSSSYSLLENYKIGVLSEIPKITTIASITASDEPEEEQYSVEIEGQEMKLKTIKEIADLWQINADDLLNLIIREFDLKGTYSTSTILEDFRDEYKFSPAQIKDIAEGLKNNTTANQTGTSQTTKPAATNPYSLIIPFFGTIIFYLIHFNISKSKLGLKYKVLSHTSFNMFWNTVLLISLIPAFGFGIFMILRYTFKDLYALKFEFLYWHVEGSIIMGTVALMHLITRLKQYFAQVKYISSNKIK